VTRSQHLCSLMLLTAFCPGLAFAEDHRGSLNPSVSQETIHSTICARGWIHAIGPQETTAHATKQRLMSDAGEYNAALFELDHVIPVELGGAPLDVRNLQLQPRTGACNARQKNELERALRRLVCTGELSLADAQHEITTDWKASYSKRIDQRGCK